MPLSEESGIYSFDQDCPIHGDTNMRECSMCGVEFCRTCHAGSTVCPDCTASMEDDMDIDEDNPERDPDFEDVSDLDKLLAGDEEVERLVDGGDDELPDEDLIDEDEADERL